ncbi:MAG: DUF3999 domain-containing protein, partial [Thiogranum sp.]
TPAGGAIYELALPEAVYAKVIHADLGDIAVFNTAGETVLHAFRRAIQADPVKPEPVKLRIFPLHDDEAGLSQQLSLKLKADFRSALIELESKPETGAKTIVAYILDVSELKQAPSQLAVSWDSTSDSFITRVSIASSNDLNHWQPRVDGAALASLHYAGNRLLQNRIDLPAHQDKYLKISWPAGHDGASITSMQAIFPEQSGDQPQLWNRYSGKRVDNEEHTAFEYEVPAHLLIAAINLYLEQKNSLLQGAVYSRQNPEHNWRLRHRGLFYRLQFPETELINPAIPVTTTTDRYWRIEYHRERSSLGTAVPALQLGWKPHQLVFLARGEGPFTLTYGSARASTEQAPVNTLLDNLKQALETLPIQQARLGQAVSPGKLEVLSPEPPPLPWRTWSLWASLVIGVLVLASLAWRLHRQIGSVKK